jgi:hypothetical protein
MARGATQEASFSNGKKLLRENSVTLLRRPKLLPPFAKPSYSQAQAGAEP